MSPSAVKQDLRIFTPIGMLGYGFSEEIFWNTIEDGVDAVILDSGSTDSGPSKLALGTLTVSREAYEHDLSILVAACHSHRVPLLIGSAGGDGENAHVDMFAEIIRDIISRENYRTMKVISIYSEIDKALIHEKLQHGAITPCGRAVPELRPIDIDQATRVVAQMGHEPFLKAMIEHPDFDIIIGGRAYDPAPYAAFCIYHGITDLGVAYHMGKIMECGALCSTPKSKEALALVRQGSFDIVPLDPLSRCTVISVAAHSLYEKTRPDVLIGPGGALHLDTAVYEQLSDDRTVRVMGARFLPMDHTVKLEGARIDGYHSVFMGGMRDPILIPQIDVFLSKVKALIKTKIFFDFDLNFHIYGKNGVMGKLEPSTNHTPKELAICCQARAETQSKATYVVNMARTYCMHGPYPNQKATAGNFAMPFAPMDIPLGRVTAFNIYHLMSISDPLELFPIHEQLIEGSGSAPPRPVALAPSIKAVAKPFPNGTTSTSTSTSTSPFLLSPPPPPGTSYLGDLASVIRSKNAGPYELTFDIMFSSAATYAAVKGCGVLNQETVARLYHIPEDEVLACLFWDQARAFKATIKRPKPSGTWGDGDVHGSAQHAPLMGLLLPIGR